MVCYEPMYKSDIQFGIIYADLVEYSSFSSVTPFSCQSSAIVKNFLTMPIILFKASTSNVYCQSPYYSCLHAVCSFHSVSNCCLKMQDFYKNVCFCTRTRSFVVLCIMVAPPVDKICSRYQLSPQILSTGGCGAPNSAVQGSFLSSIRDSVFCLSVSWGQLYILSGDNVVVFRWVRTMRVSGAQSTKGGDSFWKQERSFCQESSYDKSP